MDPADVAEKRVMVREGWSMTQTAILSRGGGESVVDRRDERVNHRESVFLIRNDKSLVHEDPEGALEGLCRIDQLKSHFFPEILQDTGVR